MFLATKDAGHTKKGVSYEVSGRMIITIRTVNRYPVVRWFLSILGSAIESTVTTSLVSMILNLRSNGLLMMGISVFLLLLLG